jgi:peptidoglycan/xylan/chitin deacetylase (PgdA/CDA1 family)
MARLKRAVARAGFETLFFSGMHHLLRPLFGGVGAILSIHHVRPRAKAAFAPNRQLDVSPRLLDTLLARFRDWKIDIVSLDEMHRRLIERDFARRFVCFTLDGAYDDHKEWAWPIFKKHEAPFALFVPTSFPDRRGELWWLALESVVAKTDQILMLINAREERILCRGVAEKERIYHELYHYLRRRETDEEIRVAVRDLCARYHVDMPELCHRYCMNWDDVAAIARDPLATIGAHSVNFPVLPKTSEAKALSEIRMSRAVIEGALGKAPAHLAYPFGDRNAAGEREFRMAAELGFKTALTARPGLLHPSDADQLMSLPRITMQAHYRPRHLRVMLSGAPLR